MTRRRGFRLVEIPQLLPEFFQKAQLALADLLPGGRKREPGGPVHFRKVLPVAGAGRPLQAEGVAADGAGIAVPGDGPGVNNFAAGLL